MCVRYEVTECLEVLDTAKGNEGLVLADMMRRVKTLQNGNGQEQGKLLALDVYMADMAMTAHIDCGEDLDGLFRHLSRVSGGYGIFLHYAYTWSCEMEEEPLDPMVLTNRLAECPDDMLTGFRYTLTVRSDRSFAGQGITLVYGAGMDGRQSHGNPDGMPEETMMGRMQEPGTAFRTFPGQADIFPPATVNPVLSRQCA